MLGHLFQDRYRSEPVETDSYFLELMKYIFQNPVKAGLTTDPLTYRWLECGRVKAENDLVDDVGEYTSLSREELLDFFRQNVQHDYKEIEKSFSGKTLLITGGTGSFGNKVLDRFLQDDIELKESIGEEMAYISSGAY